MRTIIYTILLLTPIIGNSQSNIRMFVGTNISNVRYTLKDNVTNTDSMGWKTPYILPYLGLDIGFEINDRFSMGTGLAASFMGAKNYITNSESIPGLNIDSNFRVLYLRLPITMKYEIAGPLKAFAGISINHSVRKNLNFFAADVGSFNFQDIYNPFHFGALIGLSYQLNKVRLDVNYHYGLNRIWDTHEYDPSRRAYLSLNAFQFSIGYIFY